MTGRRSVPDPTLDLERSLAVDGADMVLGIDEVGRGCLAGPVMLGVAAISSRRLLAGEGPVDGVRDSKLLTQKRREALLPALEDWCDAWAVGSASNAEIDEFGIAYCLGLAALRAIAAVEETLRRAEGATMPGARLRFAGILDGPNDYITPVAGTLYAPPMDGPVAITTRVKGDQSCALVSTASVIAKVTRDRWMTDLAASHPEWDCYGWESNKGYGSAAHRQAIRDHGVTPYHRASWHLA